MNTLTKSRLDKVSECMIRGIESWIEAGAIVAELLAEDPRNVSVIEEYIPGISREIIYTFERIGRRELYPKLLIGNAPGIKALSRASYSQQKEYYENPIPVAIWRNDQYDIMLIKSENLTSAQCKQVFNKTLIRGKSAQIAYLESEKKAALYDAQEVESLPYMIKKNSVIFQRSCALSRKEIKMILKAMAPAKRQS